MPETTQAEQAAAHEPECTYPIARTSPDEPRNPADRGFSPRRAGAGGVSPPSGRATAGTARG